MVLGLPESWKGVDYVTYNGIKISARFPCFTAGIAGAVDFSAAVPPKTAIPRTGGVYVYISLVLNGFEYT